jgi:phosphate transport system permease protein
MKIKKRVTGGLVIGATAFSAFLILSIIVIMLVVIVIGGKDTFSWKFLTTFPEDGMMKGGVFPAIYGTASLVLIM